jgi:hypothetical protein
MKRTFMKKTIILFMVGLITHHIAQAQGTTYVSSLGQTSTGNSSVGSNLWLATDFRTGANIGGYSFNAIDIGMTNALGSPSGFTVMIYTAVINTADFPGSSLGTLSGSLNPVTAGTYTYIPTNNLTLSPSTDYWIVVTDGTAIANGAYEWSVTGTFSPNLNGGWHGDDTFADSSNGSTWNYIGGTYPLFAINATAVPEPSPSVLFLLCGLFIYVRRTFCR